jgi:hypothetical protein
VTVFGTGTNFSSSFVGKNLYYFNNNIPVILGVVTKFVSTIRLEIAMLPESVDISDVRAGIESAILPNQRPAIEVLKELAGIEGSIFGSGFSRNFYINRLTDTQTPVELDYANVINAKLNRTSLYLGNSIVTQLSAQTSRLVSKVKKKKSFWDKLFGRQRFTTEVSDLPDDPYGTYPSTDTDPASRQLPVMRRVTSGNIGNPRASKELRIELAPAYPLLSKGEGSVNINFIGQKVLAADGNGVLADTSLESALTANGLRNYLRALSSVDGDFVVDFEIKGAFSLKPYETFQFTDAPERYQGKTYRVSEIRYNLLADTVKVKGYKINEFDANIIPSSPLIESINVSTGVLNFDWDTTKPVISSVDVSATGVAGSLQVTCSSGFYSINTDPTDNLWRNSITLNTDGFGVLSQRIYVRFNPSATGIVSDSLLYGVLQVNGQSQTARTELRANVIAPQSEFYIGQVDGIIGGDTLSSITANMFTEIEQGREITLVGENKGYRYTITPTEDVFTGDNTFAIEPQFIEKDRYHVEVSQNADRTGITVSEREIVLKVKSDGTIASVRLSADAEAGSEINIVADQVKINDINFVSNGNIAPAYVGYVESNGYTAGVSGWRISGSGDAEFGNVVVRGSLSTSNIVGDLTMQSNGAIKNSTNDYVIDENGIQLAEYTSGLISKRGITWSNSRAQVYGNGISTDFKGAWVLGKNTVVLAVEDISGSLLEEAVKIGFDENAIYGFDFADFLFRIIARAGMQSEGTVTISNTTDSSNVATGSIITAGGAGIAKNLNVGANLRVIGTTEATSTTTGSTVLSGGLGVAKNVHIGGELIAPKEIVKFIEGADSPYGLLSNDITLLVDTSASAVTLNLPAGVEGRRITVKHIAGTASTEPVTINRNGSDTIEGNTSYTINTDLGCVSLVFYSGVWYILSEII